MQTLVIYKLGFYQNYYTLTLTLLTKIFLSGKFPWRKFKDYKWFEMSSEHVHRHLSSTLEVTQGQILSQSPTDTSRFWWHVYRKWLKQSSICPWVDSRVVRRNKCRSDPVYIKEVFSVAAWAEGQSWKSSLYPACPDPPLSPADSISEHNRT